MKAHRTRSQRGAALVEFALVMPLLLLLVFGIMEAGWLFAQQVEVRNAAREGARIAAVSAPDITGDGSFDEADVVQRTCESLDLSNGVVLVSLPPLLPDGTPVGTEVGDTATIQLTSAFVSLTGFLDSTFGSLSIDTNVQFRLEQPRQWDPVASESCP